MVSKWLAERYEQHQKSQLQQDIIDKIKGITGSNYEYQQATGIINDNFNKIGEIFGFPIYQDLGSQYVSEYPDLPTLGDLIDSIMNAGINVSVSHSDCSLCVTISFSIAILTYPPITYCITLPDCKKEEEPPIPGDCIPPDQYKDYLLNYKQQAIPKQPCKLEPPLLPDNISDTGVVDKEGILFRYSRNEGQTWSYWIFRAQGEFLFGNSNSIAPFAESTNYFHYLSGVPGLPFANLWGSGVYFKKYNEWGGGIEGFAFFIIDREGNPDTNVGVSSSPNIILEFKKPDGTPIPPKEKKITSIFPHPVIPMSSCCDDSLELLAALTKKINAIYKVINPEQFQKGDVQVPRSWIYPGHDSTPEKADDIPDAMAMILRMLDRRIGYMPQVLHLKDANPDIEGDQGKSLIVNSLADLCKHIFEFQINAGREEARVNKALLKMGGATMFEAGTTHQLAIVMERMLQAITEYLDFEAIQKKETFKMSFNPTKQLGNHNLEQHLNGMIGAHNQPIEIMEWKGGSSEKDKLNEILKKVSLCAASLSSTKPLDEVVKEAKDLARVERMLIIKEMQDREGIPDLKEFNDDAEKGYPSSNQSESVKKNPYGFGSGEPKLRRTTDKSKKRKYTNKAKAR